MGFRVARGLTGLAVVAWAYGVGHAAVVIQSRTGTWPDALFLWTLVPLLATVGAFMAARHRLVAPLWIATGLCWGFVVLAAWSLGRFFAWSAILLLAAGTTQAVALRVGWRAMTTPVWMAVGPTSLCPVLLAVDRLRATAFGASTTGAPIVVAGAWAFLALSMALGVAALIELRPGRRAS